jgi:protocatechuate 3,4-dioxygenase beta subunit
VSMLSAQLAMTIGLLMMGLLVTGLLGAAISASEECKPTPQDSLGPFYKAGAPVRTGVGKGYVLSGITKSSKDCSALDGARIEFWLAGPDGKYSDEYRATVFSDRSGAYRFESHFPPPYSGRPSHIHIRVTKDRFGLLVTQHYPVKGQTQATLDLVLAPGS